MDSHGRRRTALTVTVLIRGQRRRHPRAAHMLLKRNDFGVGPRWIKPAVRYTKLSVHWPAVSAWMAAIGGGRARKIDVSFLSFALFLRR